jgi:hypothetical protein
VNKHQKQKERKQRLQAEKILNIIHNSTKENVVDNLFNTYRTIDSCPDIMFNILDEEFLVKLEEKWENAFIQKQQAIEQQVIQNFRQDNNTLSLVEKHRQNLDQFLEMFSNIESGKCIQALYLNNPNSNEVIQSKQYLSPEDKLDDDHYFLWSAVLSKVFEYGGLIVVLNHFYPDKDVEDMSQIQVHVAEVEDDYFMDHYDARGTSYVNYYDEFLSQFLMEEEIEEIHERNLLTLSPFSLLFKDLEDKKRLKDVNLHKFDYLKKEVDEVIKLFKTFDDNLTITLTTDDDTITGFINNKSFRTQHEENLFHYSIGMGMATNAGLTLRVHLKNSEKSIIYGIALRDDNYLLLSKEDMEDCYNTDSKTGEHLPIDHNVIFNDWDHIEDIKPPYIVSNKSKSKLH